MGIKEQLKAAFIMRVPNWKITFGKDYWCCLMGIERLSLLLVIGLRLHCNNKSNYMADKKIMFNGRPGTAVEMSESQFMAFVAASRKGDPRCRYKIEDR